MSPKKKILQIIPAGGWKSVYADRGKDGKVNVSAFPLMCWALVEEQPDFGHPEPKTSVEGMDGPDYADFCEETNNFISYLGPGEDVQSKLPDAESHLRNRK